MRDTVIEVDPCFGVSVTYNPSNSSLSAIEKNYRILGNLIVYDNGSDKRSLSDLKSLRDKLQSENEEKQFIVIFDKENRGLPYAYNRCFERIRTLGAKSALLLDQDSQLPEGTLETLKDDLNYLDLNFKVGAISPTVEQDVEGPLDIFFDGTFRWKNLYEDSRVTEVPFLINSGTLLSMNTVETIGNYNESLFIDSVDHEYCFRMRKKGLRLFQSKSVLLKHNIDNKIDFRFMDIKLDRTSHNAFKDYYYARDATRVARLYLRTFPLQSIILFTNVIIKFFAVLFVYPDKRNRYRRMVKGLFDAIRY